MNRRIFIAASAVVVAFAFSPPVQAAPSDAGKEGGERSPLVGREILPPDVDARQRAQEPLMELNKRVYDVAAGFYDAQFAGSRLDVATNTLTVYWAGAVPMAMLGLREATAKAGPRLAIEPARFSHRQLMDVAAQVMPDGEIAGTVKLAVDGSGLTVTSDDLLSVVRGARSATVAETRLLQRIAAARAGSGIPITVAAALPAKEQFLTRQADGAPYWAGAQLNPAPGFCTSGFSMYASGAPSTRFTLTAAHCARFTDGVTMSNGVGAPMGVSDFIHELYDNDTVAYDLGVVRLDAANANAPYIYVGDSVRDGRIAVAGYDSRGIPANGNYCIHGMLTIGCDLWSGGTYRFCPSVGRCVYTIEMATRGGQNAVCGGDSGGPIYYWAGGVVIAAGLVSWGAISPITGCGTRGGASVVATAVNLISGLRVLTI